MVTARTLAIWGSLAILALLPACGGVSTAEDVTTASIVQKPLRPGPRDEMILPGAVDSGLTSGLDYTGTGTFVAQAQTTAPGTPGTPGTPGGTAASRTAASADGDAVTLNLVAVPIANAAKIVLGDILKLNYTVADKVAGNITIQTSTPMQRSAVVDVFEQALKLNGAVLVQGNGHYRIMPAGDGVAGAAPLANGTRRDRPGLRLQVVTLRYATASEIKRVVDPISPQGMVAKFDDARNMLVLAGTSTELAEAIDLIGVFDVDWMRGMSVALHPVSSSDPEGIVRDLEPLMGIDKDGPLRGALKVIPSKRLGSIMVITSKPHLVGRARAVIEQLDRVAAATEEQLFVHNVRNRSAIELAAILTRVLANREAGQGGTGGVAPRFDSATSTGDPTAAGLPVLTQTSASAGGIGGLAIGGTGPIGGSGTSPVAPSSASAFGASANPGAATGAPASLDADASRGPAASGGSRAPKVVADEINHSLLITATRREYERIQRILDRIDVMPTQVMLEAMIAEVTLTDQLKFGVKWHLGQSDNRITLSDAATGAVASAFPGFSYFFAGRAGSLSSVLDALSTITKVNIVSAPSLMVLDNRRATLQIGDQVPIVTQQAQAVTAGVVGPIINSVALKDTGVILSVTPRVSDNGKVVLEIEQEVSSANRTVTSGIDSPTISQRRVRTSVVVQDGDVVTLGGMIQERNTETKSQVPLLGNLPLVGAAFRQKDDRIERTELLIFIRPLVVANRKDAQAVTQELRQRLNLERPRTTIGRDVFDRDGRRILH